MKVGIDISLDVFDACIKVAGKPKWGQFANDGKGRNEFHKWLKKHEITDPQLYMEATGRYWESLADWAHKHGWEVTIINPRDIRKFADSKLGYNKTDKLDALAILRFAECAEPGELRTWQPRSAAQNELREMQLEIAGLNKMIGQERNRLKSGIRSTLVKICVRENIDHLKRQKQSLQRKAIDLIKQTAELARRYKILKSIKGFGDVTAILLLAKIDFERFVKGRQLVSYAGIAPMKFQSGKSVRRKEHISRVGHASIRNGLYFPAVVAMTHDQAVAEFAKRLKDQGKTNKVIICAVMARLLLTAFALVRDNRMNNELPQLAL